MLSNSQIVISGPLIHLGWKLEKLGNFVPFEEWMKHFEGFQGRFCSVSWLGQQETGLDGPSCPFNSILCLKDLPLKYLYVVSCKWPTVLKKLEQGN